LLYADSYHNVWFAISGPLGGPVYYLKNGELINYNPCLGIKTAISEDNDGAIWFTYPLLPSVPPSDGGAFRCFIEQDTSFNFNADNSCLSRNWNYTIYNDSYGTMWFGTDQGVCRHIKGGWNTLTVENGDLKEEDEIFSLFENSKGIICVGSRNGVSWYDGHWEYYKFWKVWPGFGWTNIKFMMEDHEDFLWLNVSGSLRKYKDTNFDDENYTGISLQGSGLKGNINSILEDRNYNRWYGLSDGLIRLDSYWNVYTTKDSSIVNNCVYTILEDKSGKIWVGTDGGISIYENQEWKQNFTVGNSGLGNNIVYSIYEDRREMLWFGTSYGISKYDGTEWIVFNPGNSNFRGGSVQAIIQDSSGAMWFGSDGGISRLDDEIWSNFNTQNSSLLSNNVKTIIEDSKNKWLWFGTPKGLTQFKGDNLPPNTLIIQKPDRTYGVSVPRFTFSGKDNLTVVDELLYSWAIKIINSELTDSDWSWFSGESFIETSPLSNGTWTFYVKSRDKFGNIDPTPDSCTFTIDITQPSTVIDYPAQNDTISQIIHITGYAFDDSPIKDFDYFNIFYGKGTAARSITEWDTLVFKDTTEIRGDTLAIWNTEGLRGTYHLKLFAQDTLGHQSQDTVGVYIVDVIEKIKNKDGGYVEDFSDNIQVYIPPNSLPENIEIKISLVSDLIPENENNQFRNFSSLAYDIMPSSLILEKPGTLSITYNDSNLVNIADEKKLSIFKYKNEKNDWMLIGGAANVNENKITTAINQLGRYGLFENLSDGGKLSISNINCQPRVFSPNGNMFDTKTAISFELGKASDVTIKIYNTAGRLIRVLMENEPKIFGNTVVDWDGKDEQGDVCVTGLYIVTIQAGDKMENKTVVVLNK